MQEYINKGTMMHLTLNGCTILNQGTIMHLNGENIQIDNKGTIMHNDGGRVIIMGSGCNQSQTKEKVVYRDRVIYRDRPIFGTEKSEQLRELEREVKELKQQLKRTPAYEKIERLENKCRYFENAYYSQKKEIEQLQQELSAADRIKLQQRIEQLTEELKRSKNRERTSREQQYAKGYQAGVVDGSNRKKEVFDWGVKPTREQADMMMKQLRIWLECEKEENNI